jgi:hypothetical protein
MAYYQDDFDKWFVKTVEFLVATRSQHRKFKTQIELAELLGLKNDAANFSAIKSGQRGVPKESRQAVEKKLNDLFGLKRNKPFPMQANEYNAPVYGNQTVPREEHLAEMLKKEESHNKFLRDVYETNLKTVQVSLETVLVNQKIMLSHISADSVLAAQRHVGDDQEQLNAELRKRDKLIGDFLKKEN